MVQLRLDSLDETLRLGTLLASEFVGSRSVGVHADRVPQQRPTVSETNGVVLALTGTLGAGKTNLAQAIISSFGVPRDEITSPTFSLVQSYRVLSGAVTIYHLDAYRIADEDEFLELGVEEMLGLPGSLSLVEWAGKVEACLPADALWIDIEYVTSSTRIVRFSSRSGLWDSWLAEIQPKFANPSRP